MLSILKCNQFLSELLAALLQSLVSHDPLEYNMLVCSSIIISYYHQCGKRLCWGIGSSIEQHFFLK